MQLASSWLFERRQIDVQVLKVPEGEWMLQNAAGSVVGRQLIAIARHKGIKTINLVSASISWP